MSKQVETEFKTLITAQKAQLIKSQLPLITVFDQTNYYYELPNKALKNHKIALRTRLFKDCGEQTLKIPQFTKTNAHRLIEITDNLTLSQANDLITQQGILQNGQIAKQLSALNIPLSELFIWGSAKTTRSLLKFHEQTVTLDMTTYPDQTTDYELEIEVSNLTIGQQYFEEICQTFEITDFIYDNKIARASQHQKKQAN